MLYIVMVLLIVLGAAMMLASLLAGIVYACKRRWKAALMWAGTMLLSAVVILGAGITIVVRGVVDISHGISRHVAEQNARQKVKVDAIRDLTPGVDWSKVDQQWWTYDGFRDWYRVPVRWPYDMHCIDLLDHGSLYKNIAAGRSDDPNVQCSQEGFDVTRYETDGKLMVYQFEDLERKTVTWGIYEFDKDSQIYAGEPTMWAAAKEKLYSGPRTLRTVREHYETYWR